MPPENELPPEGGQPDPNDPNNITIPVKPPEGETTPPPPIPTRTPRSGGEPPQVFSAEDVERIRNEERARYQAEQQRADGLQNELAQYRQSEEERAKAEEKARKDAERAAKKKEEEEMELRDLIAKKDSEWEEKLNNERAEREKMAALMEQERRYSQLQNYLAQRMAIEAEEIIPELRDLVSGNSEQEIEASIELAKQKSIAIMGQFQGTLQQQNARQRTVGVTSPPLGPMDGLPTTQTLSPDDIKALTPEEYAQHRDVLLKAASASRRQ